MKRFMIPRPIPTQFAEKLISIDNIRGAELSKNLERGLMTIPLVAHEALTTAYMRELGLYQNAEKIINIPIAMMFSLGAVIMPRATSLFSSGDVDELKKMNSLSVSSFLIVSLGCMFGLMAISKDLAPWFFGNDFKDCDVLISLLSIIVVLMAWENAIQKQYLIPIGKDRIVATCMVIAAIVNVIADAILIPRYNAVGAVIGSVLAHFVICVIESVYVRKDLPIIRYILNLVLYCLAGAIMYYAVIAVSKICFYSAGVKILVEICTGVVTYLFIIYLLISIVQTQEHNSIHKWVKGLFL